MKKAITSAVFIIAFASYAAWQHIASAPVTNALSQAPSQTQTRSYSQKSASFATKQSGLYRDGSYLGSIANAYYGNVQVKAVVSGGKLTDVQFLQYPSDRSTSVYINTQAMPMLTQEAIAAQSANVSGVSGASETSYGFVQSLSSALAQAKA